MSKSYYPARCVKKGPILWHGNEMQHTLMAGFSLGQTVVIGELLEQIRKNGDIAIIYDPTGDLYRFFFNKMTDLYFCPGLENSVFFNIFKEKTSKGSTDIFWGIVNRLIPDELCDQLGTEIVTGARGGVFDTLNDMALDYRSDLSELMGRLSELNFVDNSKNLIGDREAKPEEIDKFKAAIQHGIDAIEYLPPIRKMPEFSVTRWTRNPPLKGSVLFLSGVPALNQPRACPYNSVVTAMLDLGIRQAALLNGTRDHKVWFIIQNIASLPRIPSLLENLDSPEFRSNGRFFIGTPTFSELNQHAYPGQADTIAYACKTLMAFNTDDDQIVNLFNERFEYDLPESHEDRFTPYIGSSLNPFQVIVKIPGEVPPTLAYLSTQIRSMNNKLSIPQIGGGANAKANLDNISGPKPKPKAPPRRIGSGTPKRKKMNTGNEEMFTKEEMGPCENEKSTASNSITSQPATTVEFTDPDENNGGDSSDQGKEPQINNGNGGGNTVSGSIINNGTDGGGENSTAGDNEGDQGEEKNSSSKKSYQNPFYEN